MQVTVARSKLSKLCEVAICNFGHIKCRRLTFAKTLLELTLEEDILSISLSHEEYLLLKGMQ